MGFPLIALTAIAITLLEESPAYLLMKRDFKGCRQVLKKITEINNRPKFKFRLLPELHDINPTYTTNMDLFQSHNKTDTCSLQSEQRLMTSPSPSMWKLFRKSYPLFILWGVHYFAYFGFPLMISYGRTLVFNFTIIAAIELLGILISIKILKSFDQLKTMGYLLTACLVCCGLDAAVGKSFVFLCVVKFCLTLFFGVLQIYTLEAFDMRLRSQAYGYCFMFGRLCSIMTPLVFSQLSNVSVYSSIVLGVLFFVSLLMMLLLRPKEERGEGDRGYQ